MPKILERLFFFLGFVLIAGYAVAHIDRTLQRSASLEAFEAAQAKVLPPEARADWSEEFTKSYEESLAREAGETVGILRIDALGIEVPVFDSTDEIALNRGAGHIAGSTLPGDYGNVGIAGHRDGFFRKLKDIEPGMSIRLLSLDGWQEFEVTRVSIVDPLDVSVLSPTGEPELTLVTCYPFYFVGPAPDRFIASARLVAPNSAERLSDTFRSTNLTTGEL